MARTPSFMVPLGEEAHPFHLIDVCTNKTVKLEKNEHVKATLIMFICNHCPFVKHIFDGLVQLGKTYHNHPNVRIYAINSNNVEQYPDDSPQRMKEVAQSYGFTFPYLFDETQEVAKAYHAVCTPDFFVYDKHLKLAYRGQFDDSRPGNEHPVNGYSIRNTIDALINDMPVDGEQKPSIGCNIKWKDAH